MNQKKEVIRKMVPIGSLLLDWIYPPTCGVCGKLDGNLLCKRCELMLMAEAKFVVEKNQNKENNFEEHLYIFQYEGRIRRMILNYKFKDKSYLYKTFVNFLLKEEFFFQILQTYDTIIPVPISKKRKKERGYNQSFLIANEIAKRLQMECNTCCLVKIKNIIEQSKLKKEERVDNIQGVYELKKAEILKDKKVLLVDDIYTTGSTVNECCKMLKQAQLKNIGVLTIAKD